MKKPSVLSMAVFNMWFLLLVIALLLTSAVPMMWQQTVAIAILFIAGTVLCYTAEKQYRKRK